MLRLCELIINFAIITREVEWAVRTLVQPVQLGFDSELTLYGIVEGMFAALNAFVSPLFFCEPFRYILKWSSTGSGASTTSYLKNDLKKLTIFCALIRYCLDKCHPLFLDICLWTYSTLSPHIMIVLLHTSLIFCTLKRFFRIFVTICSFIGD